MMAETMAENTEEKMAETMAENTEEKMAETMAENTKKRKAETMAENTEEKMAETMAENTKKRKAETMAENTEEKMAETMAENTKKRKAETMAENTEEKMAETMAENTKKITAANWALRRELVEIRGLKYSPGYFSTKIFLSAEEIYSLIRKKLISTKLNRAGKDMLTYIERNRSDEFLSFPVEFSVTHLQHTTTKTGMEKILGSQSIKGRNSACKEYKLRQEMRDISFWNADISSSQIEKAREEVYTHVHKHRPDQAPEYRTEIMQQFANSPAFNKSASRYGNFTFSLPLSDLLSLYGDQFCNGEKPELSILGTDIYRLEIAHYVLVHPPDQFKDYERIPSLQTRDEALPFVYWMGDTLYWRPQSTTDVLQVLTNKNEDKMRKVQVRIESFCAWNLLTFAFHIPDGRALKIPGQKLTDNLSACEILTPFLKDQEVKKYEAEQEIKKRQDQKVPDSSQMGQ